MYFHYFKGEKLSGPSIESGPSAYSVGVLPSAPPRQLD